MIKTIKDFGIFGVESLIQNRRVESFGNRFPDLNNVVKLVRIERRVAVDVVVKFVIF